MPEERIIKINCTSERYSVYSGPMINNVFFIPRLQKKMLLHFWIFMNSGNTVVPEYGDQFETRAYLSSGTGYSIGGRYSFADLVYDGVYT